MAKKKRLSPAAREGLRIAGAHGSLPPQECVKCKADLSDPDVTPEHEEYRVMFGKAIEIPIATPGIAVWRCPVCDHTWQKHPIVGANR